jgi:hypothetical protein
VRCFALISVGFYACAHPTPAPVLQHAALPAPRPVVETPAPIVEPDPDPNATTVAVGDWHDLQYSAKVVDHSLRWNVGCKSVGMAAASARLPAGTWALRVDYHAECDRATQVQIGGQTFEGLALWLPIAGLREVMERCPLTLDAPADVAVQLYANGGLSCMGKGELVSAVFERVPPAWSPLRCDWLYEELAMKSTEQVLELLRELP